MLYDKYLKLKEAKRDKLYLLKKGNFYVTYDMDSIIINNLFGYKVKIFKKYSMIGFPINSLEKVKDKLEESNIDYLVYNFKEEEILYNNEYEKNNYNQKLLLSHSTYSNRNAIIDNIIVKINTFDVETLKYIEYVINSIN
ncbi:MAG: hypothetical protein PHN72_01280 [Bacilli bacterium]|nr:hypothetical protein [Bacilli bacterium]